MAVGDSKKRTQFNLEMEQSVAVANREVMKGAKIPPVNKDSVLPLAIAVAQLRAQYLKAAFSIGSADRKEPPVDAELAELRKFREAYQEGVAAFDALMRAVERGYIELDSEAAKSKE